jgi:hypothetical protein
MRPRNLLILIGADPRTSSRPAEAVRIGAGLGAWQKVRVSVYFHGPAVACLTEFPETLEEGRLIEQYLPMILSHDGDLFAEADHPMLANRPSDLVVMEFSAEALREVLGRADHSMNFDAELPFFEGPARLGAAEVDYDELLDRILRGDTVHVW